MAASAARRIKSSPRFEIRMGAGSSSPLRKMLGGAPAEVLLPSALATATGAGLPEPAEFEAGGGVEFSRDGSAGWPRTSLGRPGSSEAWEGGGTFSAERDSVGGASPEESD